MEASNEWYVAVGDESVGPVGTELVIRGIEHGRIPPEALVCEVGGSSWVTLETIDAFHSAVVRSYPPPALESEETQPEEAQYADDADDEDDEPEEAQYANDEDEEEEAAPPVYANGRASQADLDIDIDVAAPPAIDWNERFHSYFLVDGDIELPEERALLESLSSVPRDTFRNDEAMWNLALCLAFGSDDVGYAAAKTFFDAVAQHNSLDRLEWMSRTLLSTGFVPTGIPAEAGRRAVARLRSQCPASLARKLPRDLA